MPSNNFPIRNQMASDQIEDLGRKRELAIMVLNKMAGKVPIPLPYQVGDQVWLEVTHLCLPYQSSKLAPKRHGPFSITKEISLVTYQLCLPAAWNIHDVFHTSLLSLYHKSMEHGPNYSRPPPDLLEGEEEYKVEHIINHQCFGKARTLQYLIKWKGYPDADNTWEPADQVHAPDLTNAYHQTNPLGPLKRQLPRTKRTIHSSSLLHTRTRCPTTLQAHRMSPPLRPGSHRPPPLKGPDNMAHRYPLQGHSLSKKPSEG
jgi:chromodomain-containing protein